MQLSLHYSPTGKNLIVRTSQKTDCFSARSLDELLAKAFEDFPKSSWIMQVSSNLCRVGWINLKTLLDKTFRLFSPQKVPAIAGIGGKIQVLFPWKLGSWPRRFDRLTVHSTELRRTSWKSIKPHTPHPTPRKSFFSKPCVSWQKRYFARIFRA